VADWLSPHELSTALGAFAGLSAAPHDALLQVARGLKKTPEPQTFAPLSGRDQRRAAAPPALSAAPAGQVLLRRAAALAGACNAQDVTTLLSAMAHTRSSPLRPPPPFPPVLSGHAASLTPY